MQDWIEDADEVKQRRAKIEKRRLEKERSFRTQAFQRGLPIPSKLNDQYYKRSLSANDLTNVSPFSLLLTSLMAVNNLVP